MKPSLLFFWLLSIALVWGQTVLESPPATAPVDAAPAPESEAPAPDGKESEEKDEVEDGGTTGVEESSDPPSGEAAVEPVQIFGWKEWIVLEGQEAAVKAKLDTGAKTSSIHSEDVKVIEKDGGKWVRFTVVVPSASGEPDHSMKMEAPFTRMAKIRNADGVLSERIVVRLKFRIGALKREAEFSLNDRGDMIHPILLGRTTINTLGFVDTNRIYLAEEKVMR